MKKKEFNWPKFHEQLLHGASSEERSNDALAMIALLKRHGLPVPKVKVPEWKCGGVKRLEDGLIDWSLYQLDSRFWDVLWDFADKLNKKEQDACFVDVVKHRIAVALRHKVDVKTLLHAIGKHNALQQYAIDLWENRHSGRPPDELRPDEDTDLEWASLELDWLYEIFQQQFGHRIRKEKPTAVEIICLRNGIADANELIAYRSNRSRRKAVPVWKIAINIYLKSILDKGRNGDQKLMDDLAKQIHATHKS